MESALAAPKALTAASPASVAMSIDVERLRMSVVWNQQEAFSTPMRPLDGRDEVRPPLAARAQVSIRRARPAPVPPLLLGNGAVRRPTASLCAALRRRRRNTLPRDVVRSF